MSALTSFLSSDAQKRVVLAIKEAELNTSGEIRIHLEPKCKGDAMERAFYLFKRLKMDETQERNGVLIYIAFNSHDIAVIADEGINRVVPIDYWRGICDTLQERFSEGESEKGLVTAILKIGNELKHYFPYNKDDINEQSDEISIGE